MFTLEDKVVSCDLAKRLNDVGLIQGISERVWYEHPINSCCFKVLARDKLFLGRGIYIIPESDAPDCVEILDMLPNTIERYGDTGALQIGKMDDDYYANYVKAGGDLVWKQGRLSNLAEALGSLLLLCLETGTLETGD